MKEADCYPGKSIGRLTLISRKRVINGNGTTSGGWLCKCDRGDRLFRINQNIKDDEMKERVCQ